MNIITVPQLEIFMGTTFSDTQRLQAAQLCALATHAVTSLTGITFGPVDDEMVQMQSDGHGIIELLEKPIRAVTTVTKWDELDEDDGWKWDGMAGIYNLAPHTTYTIVYSFGTLNIPGDVEIVALGMTSRVMYNPTGIRQETVGAISITYPGIGGEAGSVNVSNLEEKILEKYRPLGWSYRTGINALREQKLPVLTTWNNIN
jgi:hypothetical protein